MMATENQKNRKTLKLVGRIFSWILFISAIIGLINFPENIDKLISIIFYLGMKTTFSQNFLQWIFLIIGLLGLYICSGVHKTTWQVIKQYRLLFIIIILTGFAIGSLMTRPYHKQNIEFKNITVAEQEQAKLQKFATPDELIASHLKDKTIRIADLAREDNIIRNRIFEDCYIYGPAIVVLQGETIMIVNCSFAESLDDIFLTITKDRRLVGFIGCLDCKFIRCNFRGIGFLGTPEFKEIFKKGTKEIK